MTDTRYSKAIEVNETTTVPPAKRRKPDSDPPESSKGITLSGRGWKAHVPTAIIAAALSFGATLFARPHVDVSRIETKLTALDSKVGQLNDTIATSIDAVKQRQANDSDKFTNAISDLVRAGDKRDHQLERLGDQYVALALRIERVERR